MAPSFAVVRMCFSKGAMASRDKRSCAPIGLSWLTRVHSQLSCFRACWECEGMRPPWPQAAWPNCHSFACFRLKDRVPVSLRGGAYVSCLLRRRSVCNIRAGADAFTPASKPNHPPLSLSLGRRGQSKPPDKNAHPIVLIGKGV